jgi:hypothetical protein
VSTSTGYVPRAGGRRRGTGLSPRSVPPSAASRRALSRAISAWSPACSTAVFSRSPHNSWAFASSASSMIRVVRICINMVDPCRLVNGRPVPPSGSREPLHFPAVIDAERFRRMRLPSPARTTPKHRANGAGLGGSRDGLTAFLAGAREHCNGDSAHLEPATGASNEIRSTRCQALHQCCCSLAQGRLLGEFPRAKAATVERAHRAPSGHKVLVITITMVH